MAARSYTDFWSALKQQTLAPAYYFFGAEDVLKDEALAALLDQALDPGLRDFNLDTRSAATLAPEDVEALCTTLPMMAERRVVVVRDVESWSRKARAKSFMLAQLERPSPETVVVLIQGSGEPDPDTELVKPTFAVEFGAMRAEHALRWVVRRAEHLGLTLEPEAARLLLAAVDGGLGAAASELAKLAGLGLDPVTAEAVETLLGVRRGETQFDWRDAVLGDEPARAAAMLPHLLEQPGMSGVKLVTLLGQGLVGVGLARTLYDRRQRGSTLERGVFDALRRIRLWGIDYKASARAWAAWAPAWPRPRLQAALAATLAADQALKSTTISGEEGIVTDLVLRLALEQREAA